LNNVPSKSVPKTPQELWTGKRTTLKHFFIWGCPAHVLDKELAKLDSHSEVCMFVGYPRETKGGYFYNPKENKVLVSTNVIFLGESYIQELSLKVRLYVRKCPTALLLWRLLMWIVVQSMKKDKLNNKSLGRFIVMGG